LAAKKRQRRNHPEWLTAKYAKYAKAELPVFAFFAWFAVKKLHF